jgi:hypothetical protein
VENVPIGVSEDLAANVGEKHKFIDAKLFFFFLNPVLLLLGRSPMVEVRLRGGCCVNSARWKAKQ